MSWLDIFKRKKFPPEAYQPIHYEGMLRVKPLKMEILLGGEPENVGDIEMPLQIFRNGKWEDM